MRCIEIYIDDRLNAGKSKININMRCIEIFQKFLDFLVLPVLD